MTYYGKDLKGANLPFNFLLLHSAWSAEAVAQIISEYDSALPAGAWPNWVLGNHDNTRIATGIGSRQAWIAATLLLTLPGTLTMYYGEEIGMTNVSIPPDQVQDPAEKKEPDLAWAATRKELLCRGTVPLLLDSLPGGPGYLSAPIMKK